ncbi:intracellular proteinase I, partial [Pseudoalteromonas sp. 1181_04]
LDADHDIGNFTSFLRVCCSRYLSLVADGNLTREDAIPLNDIDATQVLEQEKLRTSVRKSQYIDTSLKSSLN